MVTIKDIAQATGVSFTTVSNVINGKHHRVSAETIARINDAIKELGYVPNMSARSLVSSSSKVIGFINHVVTKDDSNFMEDPFHSIFIGVLERVLRENGYYLMLRTVATAGELMAFLQNWNVDGLFFTGIFKDSFFDSFSALNIPVILVDSYIADTRICNIGLEDFTGSYLAASHLIENNHQKIAFVCPPLREGGVIHARFRGYRKALEDHGIPFDPALVLDGEMDLESCRLLCDRLLAIPGLTGLAVAADIMAANLITCLREKGSLVPQDISVVGFDDISLSQVITPPLTTIHQDMNRKGALAVEMMIRLLEGDRLPETHISLPVHLVRRESVRKL